MTIWGINFADGNGAALNIFDVLHPISETIILRDIEISIRRKSRRSKCSLNGIIGNPEEWWSFAQDRALTRRYNVEIFRISDKDDII
jgi:hypothetical protein